ncbi:hypothetical protein ACEWY4_001805 [Coilia grayii]|uniref:C-type lectin domain-containing protein n=1 Tax=Coilia grayii TaxID=363190 RepID=A0ABD1KU00_9TELE
MQATPVFVLWVFFSGLALGLVRDHYFVDQPMSWQEARTFCRQHYTDLSSIPNLQENNILKNILQETRFRSSWIGFHSCEHLCGYWLWSDGTRSDYRNWASLKPYPSITMECVKMLTDGLWVSDYCSDTKPFFCIWQHREFFLVTEKMSWEEALLHCREKYTDLASMLTPQETRLADRRANGTQTDQVWTSLRFLAGEWLWVNERGCPRRKFTQGSLPNCPAQPYSCGARSPGLGLWENRDCEERLNFLCYRD